MIDTHCHINTEQFDEDREEALKKAFDEGVEKIIIPAIESKDYPFLLEFTNSHNNVFCGMGIHPHNSNEFDADVANMMKDNIKNNDKVVAVGEIGLDYYYDFVPKDKQKEAFREQIKIAKEMDLPVIVHNRDSDDDLLDIIEDEQDGNLRGVIHCFSSPLNIMNRALDAGFHISFTGNITFKKSEHREVIENVPNDRFMLETDSPYMAPFPKRGKRNEPSNLKYVAEKIAEIKSLPINEVIKMTSENAKKLFRIAIVIFFLSLFSESAVAQDWNDGYHYEGHYADTLPHPYPKTFGIGVVLGSNTLVTTYRDDDDKVSDAVLFGYGVSLDYQLFEYLLLDATYLYTKNANNVITVEDQFEQQWTNKPNYDHLFEFTSNWLFNPRNRVNFYGILGLSYLYTDISQINYTNDAVVIDERSTSNFGIASGIGFITNIPVKSIGLIAITAEWRINFMLNDVTLENDPRKFRVADEPGSEFYKEVEVGKFYSIPRIILKWYPDFK
jgi:TatD DNase family protein